MRVTVAKKSTANASKTSSSSDYYSSVDDDDDDASSSTTTTTILDQISGAARPGRLLCVLGPSGSGKDDVFKRFEWEVKGRKERGAHATMDTEEKEEHSSKGVFQKKEMFDICVFFWARAKEKNDWSIS